MAPDVTAPSLERLVDHFVPVAPDRIEDEFARIWQESAGIGHDDSTVRLRVSNLVAWGREEDAAERFERVMERLPQRHPCRGILAVTAADARGVESAISAHCWRTSGGGRHFCSEEILLRARPGDEHALATAVLALLVPELPARVWLVGDVDITELADEIGRAADDLFVDSASARDQLAALGAISRALASGDARVIDLAWQRTTVWRELIAQLFDGAAGAELDRLMRIEISGGRDGPASAALLVGGWLASRLGLAIAAGTRAQAGLLATYYDGTRPVEMCLESSHGGLELERVRLSSADAEFLVEMHRNSGHLHVRSTLAHAPVHRIVAPDADDEASVLAAAIDDVSSPDVFEEALFSALVLAGHR
jgi:glucose-6-phosphate dehydrogenase assembly protein OpcA